MNYSSQSHPDENSLSAFLGQADSLQSEDISLHLAECLSCRKQVATMIRLKEGAASLPQVNANDQQQQLLEYYMYGQLMGHEKGLLKQQIKNDPLLLKLALLTLSQQAIESEQESSKPQMTQSVVKRSLFSEMKKWLQSLSSSWLTIPVTAFASLLFAVLVFQLTGFNQEKQVTVSIASFQDHNVIRFVPKNNMPGIGFFTSAKQHTAPYQNMVISVNEKQQVELAWQAVENASEYNLQINRFSEGKKQLHEKITTQLTRTTMKLSEADFNQRFEWTLSGKTTDDKAFITSGGFVMSRTGK